MNVRTYAALILTTLATAVVAAPSTASAALVIDTFESYTNGQVLGSSATSTPYLRFGAIADGFSATTAADRVINGSVSGQIPLSWSTSNSASVRRNYTTAAAQDFSAYDQVSISLKSMNAATTARVQLSFASGDTTWQTTLALPLFGVATTYTFNLNAAEMTLAGGAGSFADSLASVSAIGFRIQNTVGSASERIIFDDFTLNSAAPVPEPAALGLLGVAGTALLARRRRQA